ncbi:hypothetical protein D3C73_924350 [compost metagenome]
MSPRSFITVMRAPASPLPISWVPLSLSDATTVAGGVVSTAVTELMGDMFSLSSVRVT